MEKSLTIQQQLIGDQAFYLQADYPTNTQADFECHSVLPEVSYSTTLEAKIYRIAKFLFSLLVFPILIWNIFHTIVAIIILKGCGSPSLIATGDERRKVQLNDDWKYKRLTIEADGYKIDAMLCGKPSTFSNGRWTLFSNGNASVFEKHLVKPFYRQLLTHTCANGVFFNYPGVGASTGFPSKTAMAKAYAAMMRFLEDEEKGIGAKEIISYGHSLGGGAQVEGLKWHTLKPGNRYVFVKSRTFASTAKVVREWVRPINHTLAVVAEYTFRSTGWNISCEEHTKKSAIPQIVLQTAEVKEAKEVDKAAEIMDDGIIPKGATLAEAILDDRPLEIDAKAQKTFIIGIKEKHKEAIANADVIADKINTALSSPYAKVAEPSRSSFFSYSSILRGIATFKGLSFKVFSAWRTTRASSATIS